MANPQQTTSVKSDFIKCRVVAPYWGAYAKGQIVDATQKEIDQTTHRSAAGTVMSRALLPIAEEEAMKKSEAKPDETEKIQKAQAAKREAWTQLDREAEIANRQRETAAIREMLARQGAA